MGQVSELNILYNYWEKIQEGILYLVWGSEVGCGLLWRSPWKSTRTKRYGGFIVSHNSISLKVRWNAAGLEIPSTFLANCLPILPNAKRWAGVIC